MYSGGAISHRDAWVYSYSQNNLKENMINMIHHFNDESKRFKNSDKRLNIEEFVDKDQTKIKWNKRLFENAQNGKTFDFIEKDIITSLYRPFTKQKYYYNKDFNWSRYLQPKLYPIEQLANKTICIEGVGSVSYTHLDVYKRQA